MSHRDHRHHIPAATYRIQLTSELGFARAAALVDYLHDLGVDTLYASPILAARANSTSGYDVIDPRRLDSKLGTEAELDVLANALSERDMGMVLDIVPNHMAVTSENPFWADILARGQGSEYAGVFDIDWQAGPGLPGEEPRITLPVLGAPFADILARGELRVVHEHGELVARYYDHVFPLAEGTAPADVTYPISHADTIAAVLDRQFYQLGYWRVAAQNVNYRRFFDISDLIGVRVEDPEIFDLTHALILALARRGVITGLRIDHIDGLHNPHQYLHRLQRALPATREPLDATTLDSGQPNTEQPGFYVIVEKILSGSEVLREDWPVQGTTGYEFVRALSGVFVDAHGLNALERIYARFLGFKQPFAERLYQQKKRVMHDLFAGEIRARVAELCRLAARDTTARDLFARDIEQAFIELMACFPVYRTYIRDLHNLHPDDRRHIRAALGEARGRNLMVPPLAYDFIERVLTLDLPAYISAPHRRAWLEFVLRWQQLTGPVMAKGLEDTALYQDFRLLSLNSVGGEPDPEAESLHLDAFHRHNTTQQATWPHGMVATSTHDSKRSEDVRARLHVLSDLPVAWSRALSRWSTHNQRHKRTVNDIAVPSRNEEVLIYQTLLGAWPLDPGERDTFVDRLTAYIVKAGREAKQRTSWIDTNEPYERALVEFVRAIVDERENAGFMNDFFAFHRRLAFYGAINALSQVILKITSPGVPDVYQGTELWNFTLVDPDNRRPVDFDLRRTLLHELRTSALEPRQLCRALLHSWHDGRIKLYVTHKALQFRRAHRMLFCHGDYLPVQTEGTRADSVCAYARHLNGASDPGHHEWSLTVVPMRVGRLTSPDSWPLGKRCWKNTMLALPPGAPAKWRNIFSGAVLSADTTGMLPVANVMRTLPIAVLQGTTGTPPKP